MNIIILIILVQFGTSIIGRKRLLMRNNLHGNYILKFIIIKNSFSGGIEIITITVTELT